MTEQQTPGMGSGLAFFMGLVVAVGLVLVYFYRTVIADLLHNNSLAAAAAVAVSPHEGATMINSAGYVCDPALQIGCGEKFERKE